MTALQTKCTPVKRILNQKEILATLGISKTTLWRMVKAGKFPAPIRIGERLNGWKVEVFEEWLKSK